MKEMRNSMLNYLGYLFAIMILTFTGYQTYSLLYEASRSSLVAVLGLVLFEGSMLYWWAFFLSEAEGLWQMGLSLLVALFGLLLVGGATALHLRAISTDILGSQTPARLITVAAIINLVAKFLMPLLHPEVAKQIYKKALTGRVMASTFLQFETKVKEIATEIADEIAEDWKNDMRQELLAWQMNRPPLVLPTGGNVIEVAGTTAVVTPPTPAPVASPTPTSADRSVEKPLLTHSANGQGEPHAPFGPGSMAM